MPDAELILASASPRRKELLANLGVPFTCDPASIDETPFPSEEAAPYVARMALEKARVVSTRYTQRAAIVLGSDTSVVLEGQILGKPESADHARAILRSLSGRSHCVMTAIALVGSPGVPLDPESRVVVTTVTFTPLNDSAIDAYLETDEPWDKAGAYGIQGIAGAFVERIEGSYSNVVGLPLAETRSLLYASGIPTRFEGRSSGL